MTDAPAYETLLFTVADAVATVTLNRPDKLNAMSPQMRAELTDAMKRAETQARAVLITGAGKAFCAGQDLEDVRNSELERTLREEYRPMLDAVAHCRVPTVAAVNGAAAGAGAHLAMCVDICVAARSAKFVEPFAKIALIPAGAGSYWLPRLVGPARARGLTLLSEPITAETAQAWGLIWEAAPDETALSRAQEIAARLAAGPTEGFRLTKQALASSLANDWDAQLTLEAELQGAAGRTEDYKEGVDAFLTKRKPRFEGR